MLELRYGGCGDCLNTAKALLRNVGLFVNRDYYVTFHQDHRSDRIYSKRPDYLKITSGAIIYNPETESWIDFYSQDKMHCDVCDMDSKKFSGLVRELNRGQ